ncbi:MAG TPA: alpha/beta hydrolase [Mycobacteriales bacterium]|nr:alpha/beta hydrolase [Mycobacteriales bacterium]
MPTAMVEGLQIAYDVVGDSAHDGGRTWSITPGGRFSMDSPGIRELAEALAERGNQVLIWDRPNCGASDVCFTGDNESAMQADVLIGLLDQLGMTPAVIMGGSGGARVSLLAAARHPEKAAGVAMLNMSGGLYGLMTLGVHYCGGSLATAWTKDMAAVADLPEWAEVIARNPHNRQRFLDQDRAQFIATMERWMAAYVDKDDELVPGLPVAHARALDVPALVFRSGASDVNHTRATSERVAQLLPRATLVEPPWADTEWNERMAEGPAAGLFRRWPLIAPQLDDWAKAHLVT